MIEVFFVPYLNINSSLNFQIYQLSLNVIMKKFFQIYFLLLASYNWAQTDYSKNWEDFYSYANVKDFVKVNNQIYALVDNAVFIYNTSTNQTQKFSSVNGLSGEITSSINYNELSNKVSVGYSNGLLEIIDLNKKNIAASAKDIINFSYSGNKQINNIASFGSNLYLATPFAIIVYNLANLEFGDTYFIGSQSSELNINQIVIFNNTIYAATSDGIYTADINNSNLVDFNNWTKYFSGNFKNIEVFDNEVFTTKNNNLYKINGTSLLLQNSYPQSILKLKASDNYLAITTLNNVYAIDKTNAEIIHLMSTSNSSYNFNANVAMVDNDAVYIGTKKFGILKSTMQNNIDFKEIHPQGPSSNFPFSIAAKNKNLWIVYGGYDDAYTPMSKNYGFSHFNGVNWINTPYNSQFPAKNLVNITFDPSNDQKVYLSSWGNGMLIVENDEITNFWTNNNSGLEKLDYPDPSYISIRINGTAFDKQGNLWIANAWVDKRIKKYSTSGQWSGFDMSSVMTDPALGLNELTIDKTNSIWIGSRRNGVLVFNENGNQKRALTTEQTKGSLPDLNARTVKADSKNRIWIGTKKGLVVFYNTASVFTDAIIDAQPIIIVDDGIPKKLLGDQTINTIAIDGADNKWFGTDLGGVMQTNPDGSKVLQSFNTGNSPLPSNTILKIAVDVSTGKVYFATAKGIVAFKSNVAAYSDGLPDVYAYPNPSTKNNEIITIDGRNGTHLPNGTNVKILDTAGNLVYETNVKEGQELFGGKVVWNKRNLAGVKVASGVYIAMLTYNNGTENKIVKIAIIN